jgi:hypothetical protein
VRISSRLALKDDLLLGHVSPRLMRLIRLNRCRDHMLEVAYADLRT